MGTALLILRLILQFWVVLLGSSPSVGTFSSTADSPELSDLLISGSIIMDAKPIDVYYGVLDVGIIVGPYIRGLIIQ